MKNTLIGIGAAIAVIVGVLAFSGSGHGGRGGHETVFFGGWHGWHGGHSGHGGHNH